MKLILIRGLPGSGKTTLAERLMIEEDARHFEADHFMENTGEYEFRPELLEAAHAWCFGETIYNLKQGTNVIVSNTFTKLWEIERYVTNADNLGAEIEIIHVTTQFESVHGVPSDVLKAMKARFVSNDKLAQHLGTDIRYRLYPDA